tara:strand:+ start:447 stop:653 length:207 start_codon:yes stop_codon:yes gene_type:complete
MTKRQAELLKYITSYIRWHGYSPSYEDMMKGLRLKSKSGIHRLVYALVKRNKIKHHPYNARSIEVVDG